MTADDILQTLRHLEVELHQAETRLNEARLRELLHPEFEEFGRSGRRYCLNEILTELSSEKELPEVQSKDFAVASLDEGLALLTYKSAHVTPSGGLDRHTLRSSLWIRMAEGWQMRFHQGTPTGEG
jgi:hypothetical protein